MVPATWVFPPQLTEPSTDTSPETNLFWRVPHWDFFPQQEKNYKSLKTWVWSPPKCGRTDSMKFSFYLARTPWHACAPNIQHAHIQSTYIYIQYTHKMHTYTLTQHTHIHRYTQCTQIYTHTEIIYYFQFFQEPELYNTEWLWCWSLLCILFCQTFRFPFF